MFLKLNMFDYFTKYIVYRVHTFAHCTEVGTCGDIPLKPTATHVPPMNPSRLVIKAPPHNINSDKCKKLWDEYAGVTTKLRNRDLEKRKSIVAVFDLQSMLL